MKYLKKVIDVWGGYFLSLVQLRQTRLAVEKLRTGRLGAGDAPVAKASVSKANGGKAVFEMMYVEALLRSRSEKLEQPFDPNAHFKAEKEMSIVFSTGRAKDFDGGHFENLKYFLRTSYISHRNAARHDLVAVTAMGPTYINHLETIIRSLYFEIPVFFFGASFFAGYASLLDEKSSFFDRKVLGFIVDDIGAYLDYRVPSRLETSLNDAALGLTPEQLSEARFLIDKIVANRITKYNRYVDDVAPENKVESGYVLVVDQNRSDASVTYSGADNAHFDRMLEAAISENPGKTVCIKSDPDSMFAEGVAFSSREGTMLLPDDVSVVDAIENASSVYTVSSQIGFEALLRQKHVVVWGRPFYAGWGLTDDRAAMPRRNNRRSIEELFYFACVSYSVYIDPATGKLTDLSHTIDRLLEMRRSGY